MNPLSDGATAELTKLASDWDHAMVRNDAVAIGSYMADDWTIIGTDGHVGDKQTFLGFIESGMLTHDVMESHDLQVRVYGEAAVVIARGISGGTFDAQPFYFVERVSSVFVRQAGEWKCVSTHLSPLMERS